MKKLSLIILALLTILFVIVSCDNSVDDLLELETDPYKMPLTFEFPTEGTVVVTKIGDPGTVFYSADGGASKAEVISGIPIYVHANSKISLYSTRTEASPSNYINITCDCAEYCYVYGNVMSLIDSENFATKTDVFEYAFYALFDKNFHINNHETMPLVLPATTLADWCYARMFRHSSITEAPVLPADILTSNCYYEMFYDSIYLESAPELSATSLAESCYESMFGNCTSLVDAPALPATVLAKNCYQHMFWSCKNLINAPNLPSESLEDFCYSGMFTGCTSLKTAPELPATSLAKSCYESMFWNCSSLLTAPALPASTLAENCYQFMFGACSKLTTAPTLSAETLVEGCYYQMFRDCTSLNSITCLATSLCFGATDGWVYGVQTDAGTFTKASSMTSWTTGDHGIPLNWAVQDNQV